MNVLAVEALAVSYGAIPAVEDISLVVPEGGLVTVIGPNGAGKSTLLNAIMGVLPSRGAIRFLDRDLGGMPVEARVYQGIALVPEKRELFTSMSVADNLLLGSFTRLTGSRPRGDVARDLDRMYTLFPRLAERRAQFAGTLSGGEQQMLAMARALMLGPEVLLLDEPSMGLAPKLVEEVFATIALLRQNQVTMLLVEQFAAAALEVADIGYVLENGRITAHGPAAALKTDPAVRAAYLGAAH